MLKRSDFPLAVRQTPLYIAAFLLFLDATIIRVWLFLTQPVTGSGVDAAIDRSLPAWDIGWTVLLLLFTLLINLYLILRWYKKIYYLFQDKVTLEQGVLFTRVRTVRFPSLDVLKLKQSIIGKIFNIGTITITSSETGETFQLTSIPRPQYYLEIIRQHFPVAERY